MFLWFSLLSCTLCSEQSPNQYLFLVCDKIYSFFPPIFFAKVRRVAAFKMDETQA